MNIPPWVILLTLDVIIVLLVAHGLAGLRRNVGCKWTEYKRFAYMGSFVFSAGALWLTNGFVFAVQAMSLGH